MSTVEAEGEREPVAISTPAARWDRYDVAVAAVIAVVTIVLHPVGQMLTRPYWFDESWVAVLTKAPVFRLFRFSSSTPVGFLVLLRLAPSAFGLQRGRIVVLACSALTPVAAFGLTRGLGWRRRATSRFAAITVALVVMLAPVSLVRNDLKQYTCDALCAMVLLAVGARVEQTPTRNWLVAFGVVGLLAAPFSLTSMFVTVAVFGGLLVSVLSTAGRRRALEVLIAAGAAGAALAVYFVAVIRPNLSSKLHAFWAKYYLPGSPHLLTRDAWRRLVRLAPYLAMPAVVFVALFALGLVMLWQLRARALAVAMPLLWVEMVLVGRLQRYPYLDLRTSTFLLVSSLAVVAFGALRIVLWLAALAARVRGPIALVVPAAACVALAALFVSHSVKYVYDVSFPKEDMRSETRALAARWKPNDVVIVSALANFGFGYYWPHGHLSFVHNSAGQGFGARVDGIDAVYVASRDYDDIVRALRTGLERRRRAGAGSRLYIVRAHATPTELAAWHQACAVEHVEPVAVTRVGDPLLLVGAAKS